MITKDILKDNAALFTIDKNLDRLIKRIELLSYLNPLNTEKEKHRFFSSKYTEEPIFKYPKQNFNAFKLQRSLFSNQLEKIEDDDIRDREVWTGVARHWYSKASDKAPTTGRLYHHLAILARPNALQQLFYYSKSLCVVIPFTSARESILTLFEPVLNSDNV